MKKWRLLKSIASEYADIGERTLRDFLRHHTNPLPARLVRGKWLVDVDEVDVWLRSFPKAGEELDQQKIGLIYNRVVGEGHELTVRNYYLWRDFEAFLPIGSHIPFVADDGVVEFERFFYGGGLQFTFNNELFGRPNQVITGIDIDQQEDDRCGDAGL